MSMEETDVPDQHPETWSVLISADGQLCSAEACEPRIAARRTETSTVQPSNDPGVSDADQLAILETRQSAVYNNQGTRFLEDSRLSVRRPVSPTLNVKQRRRVDDTAPPTAMSVVQKNEYEDDDDNDSGRWVGKQQYIKF